MSALSEIEKISLRGRMHWQRMRGGQKPPSQIIFIHVPKCAGSSVSHHIKKCCGSSRSGRTVFFHDHFSNRALGWEADVAAGQRANFVAGHFSFETAIELAKGGEFPFIFTFLREPYARLKSFYFFLKNVPVERRAYGMKDVYLHIEDMGPSEFFTSAYAPLRYLLDNFVLRQFAGSLTEFPTTHEQGELMLQNAKLNLAKLDFVGFQEHFDEDFPRLVKRLGLPRVRQVPRSNVTDNLIKNADDRKKTRAPFDEEVEAAIEPLIRWDRELYQFAVNELRPRQP